MNFIGKAFDELQLGESFGQTLTITESHISQGCGMFGDFNPLHSNKEFAQKTRFGNLVLHGPLTSAAMSAPVGMYFYGTAIAYLEHNCRFLTPVFANDTLTTQWRIIDLSAKPKHKGGIASLKGICSNQKNKVVAEANGKILLYNRKDVVF